MPTNPFFEHIAKEILGIETLIPRNADHLDFFEANVWNVTEALEAAFAAGQLAANKKTQKSLNEGGQYMAAIEVKFDDIVAAFGQPEKGDGDKTEAEWKILFPKKQRVTIYNYKNSKCWNEKYPDIRDVTEWRVGGCNPALVDKVLGMLAGNAKLIHKAGE